MKINEPVLVTGAAGFIGFHVSRRLMDLGLHVIGVDNLTHYYDVRLKESRLHELLKFRDFEFAKADLADRATCETLFRTHRPPYVIHLAAQASVRYSIKNPYAYVDANLIGFSNVLEGCRHHGCEHLMFASSSSVYGANTKLPYSVHDNVDHPLSLYGATKKANELVAHSYSHLFGLPATGLRFFTVYGPWGRPDMAIWLFAAAILEGRPVKLYNFGKMWRDFTYIDDVVEAVVRLVRRVPVRNSQWCESAPDPGSSSAPWRIYNVGNNRPVEVPKIVEIMERELGRVANKEFLPMQAGDVHSTYADVDDLIRDVGFRPSTPIEEGIRLFLNWYRDYTAQP